MTVPITDADWEREVQCNLCGGRDLIALKTDPNWNCTFVRCASCGLMFYSPRLRENYVVRRFLSAGDAEGEAHNLFENGLLVGKPETSPEKQKQILQGYYRHILGRHSGWFERINNRKPRSIFEAGASVGWYLKVARDEFLHGASEPRARGCDANPFSAEVAKTGFGLDVFGGTLQERPIANAERNHFDLIAALDFIEHTYTPRDDLTKLRQLASPGAVMVLKTFLHELDETGAYVHPIFHVHHFTAVTLRKTIEAAGWEVMEFDDQIERTLAQVTVFAKKP